MSNTEIGLENAIITTEDVSLPIFPLMGKENKKDISGLSLLSTQQLYYLFDLLNYQCSLGELDESQTITVKAGSITINVDQFYLNTTDLNTGYLDSIKISKINKARVSTIMGQVVATLNVDYPETISKGDSITIS